MDHLEKIRRRGALVVAAIKGGDDALAKVATNFGMVDEAEIASAKAAGAKYLAEATAKAAKYFDGLKDLEKRIRQLEQQDRNARLGRSVKRNHQTHDIASAAVFAEISHRRR